MKNVLKHQYLLTLIDLKLNEYIVNFQPLEVVFRGSGTQLQVGENLNSIFLAV